MEQHIFQYQREWLLESGETLPGFELTYHTAGTLNDDCSNVIWICHALTANSNVSDWWEGLYGEGKALDPTKHFIICANVLGSCYGSTNPLSINPQTNQPYFHSFPQITIRDIVKALDQLRIHLNIHHISTLVGSSLGGQQVLEWAFLKPNLISKIIPIATNAQHSPWGIAYNETQRMAIANDPTWAESNEGAGLEGMKTARAIALLSYRSYQAYNGSQRELSTELTDHYKASSYQQYQGKKLANRFNAFSYWHLSKAMDSHHLGRGRNSVQDALAQIQAEALVIGINSDNLFPVKEQVLLFNNLPKAQLEIIDSGFGHDGFLTETEKLNPLIKHFLSTQSPTRRAATTLATTI